MKNILLKILVLFCATIMIAQPIAAKKHMRAAAPASTSFSASQRQEIQNIVHDYLLKNPKILVEMSQTLQTMREQEMAKMQGETKTLAIKHLKNLLDAKSHLVIGNPNGKLAMVEFFDYQCGNCKMMDATIMKVIQANPELQVVIIPWPFFGPESVYASKAVLAAREQNKAVELHKALLAVENPMNHDKVIMAAKKLGINVDKLNKATESKSLDDNIKTNFQLAQSLKLVATPAFIFVNRQNNKVEFILGRVTDKELQNAIMQISH